MSDLQEAVDLVTSEIAKGAIKLDDSAVAAYIQETAKFITDRGDKLTDYVLVRESGQFEVAGNDVRSSVVYKIVRANSVIKVMNPED